MKVAIKQGLQSSLPSAVNDEHNLTTFERRLVRMWKCGLLPSKICSILEISALHFCSEIDRLSRLNLDLSADIRTEDHYSKPSYKRALSQLSERELQILHGDIVFYDNQGLKVEVIGMLVEQSVRYVGEIIMKYRTRETARQSRTSQQTAARNEAVVRDFKANEHVRGVNTIISSKYGISRKMLDNILEEAGFKKTKKRIAPVREVDPKIQATHRQIVSNYLEGEQAQESKLIARLAKKYRYSETHIKNILKKANVL